MLRINTVIVLDSIFMWHMKDYFYFKGFIYLLNDTFKKVIEGGLQRY
jgi:hypothetical protein